MARKQSKRFLKKALRRREAQLNDAVVPFVYGFDFSIEPDLVPPETPEAKRQFLLLRRLKGFVHDFLWVRMRTDSRRIGKYPYLDFL
ncbi:MAG: hypothetical protein IPK58_03275 [Acidobacteria bacterium]|nr:hypothetical protein [Acidobacteriota bacterium]